MGLLRLLLIFLVAYMVMKAFRLFVVPFLFKKATDKMRNGMEDRMRDFQAQSDSRSEGEVRVETKQDKAKKERLNEGDYVEFEELD